MNRICTSIKQSEKLIELGIDRKTSDMYYWCGEDLRIGGYKVQDEEYDISAWSLTALLELIPPYLGEFNDGIDFGFSKSMNGKWYLAHYIKFNDDGLASFNKTVTEDTAIDTIFEMICWLKENNKI